MTSAPAFAWAVFTLTAAGGQTLRNALQRDLTNSLGAACATFVRFLFGCPFAFLILAGACAIADAPPPVPETRTLLVIAGAAALQIAATALMLVAMKERSFVIVTALLKTEAVQIVVFGLVFLGEAATPPLALGVLAATFGVLALSLPDPAATLRGATWRPIFYGLASAALFGGSTVGFREGVLALGGSSFIVAAATELVLGLVLQTALILLYLIVFDRGGLAAILAQWRESLSAGLLGAFATLFWFLAFALETAPRVRTLALIEVLFAQMVTRRIFAQKTGAREWLGVAMLIAGVAAVLNGG
jgi:drug/metabolite transporter (DMT)-like permease